MWNPNNPISINMDRGESSLVISLDFEMFWGVCDTQTLASYGRNVKGEWDAIPRLLAMLRRYQVRATWATVGMLMCRDYQQWREVRPEILPGYLRTKASPYQLDALVQEHPDLFFARPLIERILSTPGQELGTHTYSHFYCSEPGATPEQFAADLACAGRLAADMGVRYRSIVFPRNQIDERFLAVLPAAGIKVYRGNADHWLYRNGDAVSGGLAGRAVRLADGCLPISGDGVTQVHAEGSLINVPASLFLSPWSERLHALCAPRQARLQQCMTMAARKGGICHLWWHPHNFGVNIHKNLAVLESLLQHYSMLADRYGMQTKCMGDFARPVSVRNAEPRGQAYARTGISAEPPMAGGWQ